MFTIRGYEDDFYTGHCANGRQVIMGLLCPCLAAYYFSPGGDLLGQEARPWDYPAPGSEVQGYDIYDARFQRHLSEQVRRWQSELGFVAGPIQVHAFMDEAYPVGVGVEDDEVVLYWAREYYLAPDGEVEST